MPDFSSQFSIEPNLVPNPDFSHAGQWTLSGQGLSITDGQLVSDGTERVTAQANVAGPDPGDWLLLTITCASGSGMCLLGSGAVGFTAGRNAIFTQVSGAETIYINFEEGEAGAVEDVTAEPVVFTA